MVFTIVTHNHSSDNVYKTPNEVGATIDIQIVTSYDNTHTFYVTSDNTLLFGYLHKYIEFVQLHRDGLASLINLSDYPLIIVTTCAIYGLKFGTFTS